MNRILSILLLAGCSAASLNAQTNVLAITSQNIDITAREGEFDLKARVAVYRHNVHVEAERMQLACEVLTAKLPATGNRIEGFVGETNVVIDLVDDNGQKIHGTGDKLIYTFTVSETATNRTVELQGNPATLDMPYGPATGDTMIYDWISGKLNVTKPHMVLRSETKDKTNQVASPQPEPAAQPSPP